MNRESASDEELLELAKNAPEGDCSHFEQLVLRHQKKVVTNCRYLSRDPAGAEDLAQEVFVKAFFGLRSFEGRSAFRTWLQRIKVNHCLNFLKKRAGKGHVDIEDPALSGSPELEVAPSAEAAVASADERTRIGGVLDSMSDTLRVPLVMCDMDGFSYEEIASALGLGLSAVKMRIKRAREDFRQRYRAMGGVPPAANGRRKP